MNRFNKSLAVIGTSLAVALVSNLAVAGPFTSNYIFGDSLSDQGNLADLYRHNFGNPPFYKDAFTNGPTAVAVLSAGLGLESRASLFVTGGQDIYGLGIAPGPAGNDEPRGLDGKQLHRAHAVGSQRFTGKLKFAGHEGFQK